MIEGEQRNILTGILGTIAFHLLLLVVFLTAKIGKVKDEHHEVLLIEFSEQEYKTIEEIIEESKPKPEPIEQLSTQTISNIASNTAEKMNEQINTDKYIQDVMEELGMEEINPKYDNTLPDEEVSVTNTTKEKKKEETSTYYGQTRITYNVPGRKGRYIERPIYRCQGGGNVVVAIIVDQTGVVLQSEIESSTTSEECVMEMALQSSKNSLFSSDYTSSRKVKGTISYIFVAQ